MCTIEELIDLGKVNNASYKVQAAMTRCKVSESCQEMMEYIKANEETDHFVNPDHPKNKKDNPWIEQKKCVIL